MAQHHFYSRVPAYMSLFNHMDSYDTFAYSDGLEIEFIEKELSAIYDNKPSKGDATKIRKGELNPIFLNYTTKSGVLAQGCISFLPLDYTGERSSYFAHTIVPDEDEAGEILCDPDNAVFNPAMFKTDLDEFDISSRDCAPDEHYPESRYEPLKAENTEILEQFDPSMMKRLIFCLLNIACAKGKPVYISMPFPQKTFSEDCLRFITTLIGIFPYSLRRSFSFVTYTDEAGRFPGFNIRFLCDHTVEVPTSKGITLHFAYKLAIGLSDETVASAAALVEFFYGLISNDGVRREFLYFMDKATEKVPELKKPNLKTLTELVLVFRQCSGLFNEKSLLPNDEKMVEYIAAYEKHRKALSDEYRAVALKCLRRYPDNHAVIPKEVFSKVQKIYPTEPVASRRVIMGVVLDLIHTDVMREKLFSFIKSNFSSEEPQMKDTVIGDIGRVYYGGFLQQQIIAFFDAEFDGLSDKSKDNIVDKLLLTVRTEAVTPKIIAFFDNHYDGLSNVQKVRMYSTACDMLSHGDAIAEALITLINRHVDSEAPEITEKFGEKIYALAEANQRSKTPKLLACLVSSSGFCANVAIKGVFAHSGNKIFAHFAEIFWDLPSDKKIALFEEIWKTVPDMTVETAQTFAELLVTCSENGHGDKMSLYTLADFETAVSAHLGRSAAEKAFAEITLSKLIRPALVKALPQAFSVKQRKDGLEYIIKFAETRQYVRNSDGYANIATYVGLRDSIARRDYDGMIRAACALPEGAVRQNSAEHIRMTFIDSGLLDGEENIPTKTVTSLLVGYMKNGEFDFSAPYNDIGTLLRQNAGENGVPDVQNRALKYILGAAGLLYSSALPEEVRKRIVAPGSSLGGVVSGFVTSVKHGDKFVTGYLASSKNDKVFSAGVAAFVKEANASGGGFFSRLFGKK